MEIIVKKWEHYNRALGKYIKSKRHYIEEMKKGGFVSYDEGCRLAEQAQSKNRKAYKGLSPKAEAIVKSAQMTRDSKGRVKVGNRMIDAMKEVGVRFEVPDWCPKHYKEQGGFSAVP